MPSSMRMISLDPTTEQPWLFWTKQHVGCKRILHQARAPSRRKWLCSDSWDLARSLITSTQMVHMNLRRLQETWGGFTTSPLHTDLKPMELLKELSAESKKEQLPHLFSVVLMNNGGIRQWNAIAFCATSSTSILSTARTSCPTPTRRPAERKARRSSLLHTSSGSRKISEALYTRLELWCNTSRALTKTRPEFTSSANRCWMASFSAITRLLEEDGQATWWSSMWKLLRRLTRSMSSTPRGSKLKK